MDAMLELARMRRIRVHQEAVDDDIVIEQVDDPALIAQEARPGIFGHVGRCLDEHLSERVETGRDTARERVQVRRGLFGEAIDELARCARTIEPMQEIGAREDLFFIDSYTTASSIALSIARDKGVPSARRNVFLDSAESLLDIAGEFERLKREADEFGFAIGIGHPYPETIAYLQEALPQLAAQGIDLVFVSEALAEQRPILVLDEFAADQDPARRRFFYDVLVPRLAAAGHCVVAVTHDEHCFSKADRLIRMEDGKIVSDVMQTASVSAE